MINPSELNHAGIKGQKWGTRRYQYANKTYTPAGNERYRPSKGINTAVGITTGVVGTAWAATMIKSGAAAGITSAFNLVPLSQVATNIVTLGAEVVAGFAAIPVPIMALTIPMAIIIAPALIESGADYVNSLFK